MTPAEFLDMAILASLGMLVVAFLIMILRLVKGPSLADRVLSLDSLVTVGIGFIAIFAIKTRYPLYLDVAIALGLVGFLATVALARFIMHREGLSSDMGESSKAKDETR